MNTVKNQLRRLSFLVPSNRLPILFLAILILPLTVFISITHFDFSGDYEGIYLLRCSHGAVFDLQNEDFLGDEHKIIFRVDFQPVFDFLIKRKSIPGLTPLLHLMGVDTNATEESQIHYRWSERTGRGYVESHFPDNKRLITCFSRFKDSGNGVAPKGIFVGGGLPGAKLEDPNVTKNETGMAFFNGKEWQHLWCNANEALGIGFDPDHMLTPSHWEFLGSKILNKSKSKLILKSSHKVEFQGVPLHMDRYAVFRTDDAYFILMIVLKNRNSYDVPYFYIYGDEPWVGNFGSSEGNVGWVKDRLFYYEGMVDAAKYSYAGQYDYGNKMIPSGKSKTFSGMANFIEWLGEVRPDTVYFSNSIGRFAQESEKVPLASISNRVIFLEWGPRILRPGQSEAIILAIGMASGVDEKTHIPVKPQLLMDKSDFDFIMENSR